MDAPGILGLCAVQDAISFVISVKFLCQSAWFKFPSIYGFDLLLWLHTHFLYQKWMKEMSEPSAILLPSSELRLKQRKVCFQVNRNRSLIVCISIFVGLLSLLKICCLCSSKAHLCVTSEIRCPISVLEILFCPFMLLLHYKL